MGYGFPSLFFFPPFRKEVIRPSPLPFFAQPRKGLLLSAPVRRNEVSSFLPLFPPSAKGKGPHLWHRSCALTPHLSHPDLTFSPSSPPCVMTLKLDSPFFWFPSTFFKVGPPPFFPPASSSPSQLNLCLFLLRSLSCRLDVFLFPPLLPHHLLHYDCFERRGAIPPPSSLL